MTETATAPRLFTLPALGLEDHQAAWRLVLEVGAQRPGSGGTRGGRDGYLTERQAIAMLAALEASPRGAHGGGTGAPLQLRRRVARAVARSSLRFVVVTAAGWSDADGPRALVMLVQRALGRGDFVTVIDTEALAERLTDQERQST